LKDFVQVAPIAGQPNVLVVNPASGYKTVADLLADAKKRPGALNFGSAGIGSGTHVNAEKFKLAAAIDVLHIPYKGTPEALTDTMAGRVAYFFSPISAALPHVREGKLLALGVTSVKRAGQLPSTPTIAETGLPGFEYNLWVGMFAPAGTPADVVEKINRDVNRVMRDTDVAARVASLGAEPMPMTPAEFDRFMRSEMDDAARIVKQGAIKVQ
jgi:tripartite-type tricarboxylate transporter receptor subunit TctC